MLSRRGLGGLPTALPHSDFPPHYPTFNAPSATAPAQNKRQRLLPPLQLLSSHSVPSSSSASSSASYSSSRAGGLAAD